MVELGYYSKRLDELNDRKTEVTARLVTDRLSLKGINSEIKKCEEKMNNLTSVVDVDVPDKIVKLANQLNESNLCVESLKKEIIQLEQNLKSKDAEIECLKSKLHDLEFKQICSEPRDDVILSEKFHNNNIFYWDTEESE